MRYIIYKYECVFLFTKVRTHISEYTVSLAIRHGNYTRTRDLTNNTVLWRIRISGYGDVGQREFNPPIDKNEKERQHRPIRSSKPREFVPFAAFSISFLSKHTREKKSFAKIFSLTRYNFFPVNLFLPSPPPPTPSLSNVKYPCVEIDARNTQGLPVLSQWVFCFVYLSLYFFFFFFFSGRGRERRRSGSKHSAARSRRRNYVVTSLRPNLEPMSQVRPLTLLINNWFLLTNEKERATIKHEDPRESFASVIKKLASDTSHYQ